MYAQTQLCVGYRGCFEPYQKYAFLFTTAYSEVVMEIGNFMAITNVDRAYDLHLRDINFMRITEQEALFKIPGFSKKNVKVLQEKYRICVRFRENEMICPVATLGINVDHFKPYLVRAATTSTTSNLVKDILKVAKC